MIHPAKTLLAWPWKRARKSDQNPDKLWPGRDPLRQI
jgi:hypothetical protein